jgi:hypothetical protein
LALKKGAAKALNGWFWWVLGVMLWFGLNNLTSQKEPKRSDSQNNEDGKSS